MSSTILTGLALLSLGLTLWQFLVARRFPLHQRTTPPAFNPGVSVLKPLKGCDNQTAYCLRSWFEHDYPGEVQLLFGVRAPDDPVCAIVRDLLMEFPKADAQLIVCPEELGPNAKVSTLIQLTRLSRHDRLVVSDADVRAPEDLLQQLMGPLDQRDTGLVYCFYHLGNPGSFGMHLEAVGVNADFWGQVLQARCLKPLDFALGAVMATRREVLDAVGGFEAVADFLADDYRLGQLIAQRPERIEICPVVVECRSAAMTFPEVWRHQLRWARTIGACEPAPYFFSILGNLTLWPLLALVTSSQPPIVIEDTTSAGASAGVQSISASFSGPLILFSFCLAARFVSAYLNERKLNPGPGRVSSWWLAPVKDIFQALVWACSFLGRGVTWRGHHYRVLSGGRLARQG